MRVAITGHRPNKLDRDYTGEGDLAQRVREWMRHHLRIREPEEAITGMALGVDQWFAEEALRLDIPVFAAIPCDGQERVWPGSSQQRYHTLLAHPNVSSHIVSPGPYQVWKMQVRNEFMVDRCGLLLAVWDGSPGGTGNCVKYAEKCGKPVLQFNPRA